MVIGSQVLEQIQDLPRDKFLINGGILIITSAQMNDAGIYTCTASNLAGETSASFNVTVLM